MHLSVNTPERIKRVEKAILETQNQIDREMAYPEDLRKTERVEWLEGHKSRLIQSLKTGSL